MYKIIIPNDEDLQINLIELFENYDDYLDNDLKKILEKIRDTKPIFITEEEGNIIKCFYYYIKTLVEKIGEIKIILNRED